MRFIINDYVNKITVFDIIKFGKENKIDLSEDEANTLLFYVKSNSEDLLYGDASPILARALKTFPLDKAKKISDLFFTYRDKYKNYL